MFTLNRKTIKIQPKPVEKPSLEFSVSYSKNGTRSIVCAYFDGIRTYTEYFNQKPNGKLTQGSMIDYKRLCDVFNLSKDLRCEILSMANEDTVKLDTIKKEVVVDAAGFMKWFQ